MICYNIIGSTLICVAVSLFLQLRELDCFTDYDNTAPDAIVVKLCVGERECNIACEAPIWAKSSYYGHWVSANCTQAIETTQILVSLQRDIVYIIEIAIYGQGDCMHLMISQ